MSAAKHTPGPWWPTESGIRDRGGYIAHTKSVQRYEGQDERYVFEVAQREADKLLMATSPELLADLQQAAATLRGYEALHRAKGTAESIAKAEVNAALAARFEATIAKATGGSDKPADVKPQPNTPIALFDTLPDSAYIRESQLVLSPKRPDVVAPLPFSAPTLWRKVREGTFCKPYRLSSRVTAWKVGEVRAWIAAQEAKVYETSEVTVKLSKRTASVQA